MEGIVLRSKNAGSRPPVCSGELRRCGPRIGFGRSVARVRTARIDERVAPLIIADRGVSSGPGCMGSVAESRRGAVGFVIVRTDVMW